MSFTFIDLFAGVGGIRLGFEKFKGECVFTSEWDKYSKITYKANFGDEPQDDITKIKVQEVPRHDILLGGFPCQPFSNAGLKQGFDDTRGTLFFDVARIIDYRKPSMLLLENVKGFVNHDKGKTMKIVRETLEDLGYNVFYKVLNARDFGLPQNRERIYIVGLNKRKLGSIGFKFPEPTYKATRVGDILETKVDEKYTLSNKLWKGHKRRLKEHRAKGNGFGYSLFNRDSKYTSTISARYYKDGSEILIEQKNRNPRKLTPREAARLQGFPDGYLDFEVDGKKPSYSSVKGAIGNSMTVNVMYWIGQRINFIDNYIESQKVLKSQKK